MSVGRKIFIDCGFNTCTVLRTFIRSYPDYEFYGFEPQKELRSCADRLIEEFPDKKIILSFKAVHVANGRSRFFLANRWGENFRGASTLLPWNRKKWYRYDLERPQWVTTIDFSGWIKDNFGPEDHIIVKMDIEGMEYAVLRKMFFKGVLNWIKELYVEFHDFRNPIKDAFEKRSVAICLRIARVTIHHWT